MGSAVIAALFVERGGPYFGRDDVDPWDKERDARLYAGPHPVVAHPPCERWGRYWSGGPNANVRRELGDDDGCFAAALAAVRMWGGVLEHPEASHAFKRFGLGIPGRRDGWLPSFDGHRSFVCAVDQGHFGHPARKATWLYIVTECPVLPALPWRPATGRRLDEGFHSTTERRAARAAGKKPTRRLSHRENVLTPSAFADLLIGIARTSRLEHYA